MRMTISCALAALLVAPGPALAQKKAAAAPAREAWVTTAQIHRLNEDAPETVDTYYKGIGTSWSKAWESWSTPEDVPAEYRKRAFKHVSRVIMDVDEAGKPGGCRPIGTSPEPRLDALACTLFLRRAKFDVRYVGPGQPLAYRFAASVVWQTVAAADIAPGPPPMFFSPPAPMTPGVAQLPVPGSIDKIAGWPRLNWTKDLFVGPAPSIQNAWPGGAEGTVSLDLTLSPEKGATDCKIGISSGVAALDEAACRVARTVPVRYKQVCEFCWERTIPLQVVWKKEGSRLRLPLEPGAPGYVGTRRQIAGSITRKDLAKLPDRSVKNLEIAPLLWIDSEGRPTKCSLAYSSGNRALDARLCELIVKRMRYSKRTDVFGDAAPDLFYGRFDLEGLL